MSGQPQEESPLNKLFGRRRALEAKFHTSFILDEIEARRLARDLQFESSKGSISQIVRGAVLHELAYVEGLRGRLTSALGFMDRALRCGLDEIAIATSRAHILIMFGKFWEARKVLQDVRFEDIPDAAKGALHGLCEEVGMYQWASMLSVGNHISGKFSEEASVILSEAGIGETEITERLDYASSIVNASVSHRLIAYDLFAMQGEGILFRFVVDAPMSELVELDWALTAKVAERFGGPADEVLSIGIKPFSAGEQHLEYGAYNVNV